MYYDQIAKPQSDPVEPETDPFSMTREALKVKSAGQPRTYEKIYREVMLGGGHINADMQQFLENDKKVLRFYREDLPRGHARRRPHQRGHAAVLGERQEGAPLLRGHGRCLHPDLREAALHHLLLPGRRPGGDP